MKKKELSDFEEHRAENLSGKEDLFLCFIWAYMYSLNRYMPDKEQFEAMEREGFLRRNKREIKLKYGDPGWIDGYSWPKIAAEIMAATIPYNKK